MNEKINDFNSNSTKDFIKNKIIYIYQIIQNTIISIRQNKNNNLFSENDISLSISILVDLFEKVVQVDQELKNKYEENQLIQKLQQIIDKLSLVICGFGTKNIEDLLYVTFGSQFKDFTFKNSIIKSKYQIIKNYICPIGYKIIAKKNKSAAENNSICCDKLSEDIINIENLNNFECLDDKELNDISIINKLNHIKIIFKNNTTKKILIVNAIVEDIPIKCLQEEYILHRTNELKIHLESENLNEKEIFSNIIESLSLKDFLVFGKEDIKKRIISVVREVDFIKQNHIDAVVKQFLDKDVYLQRDFLVNLLLYKEDSDIQHTCYILYDLINTISNENNVETIGCKIYDSLPWNIRQNFKNIVKTNIQNTQQIMQKYEINKISLEQQIVLLKVDDSVKEKAMNKLKEMNGKPDEMNIKTKQYLEGLVKIPFETFYEEPIIKYMKVNNKMFKKITDEYNSLFPTLLIEKKEKYTNNELFKYIVNVEDCSIKTIQKNINDSLSNCNLKKINLIFKMINNSLKNTNNNNVSLIKKSKKSYCNHIKHFLNSMKVDNNTLCQIFDEVFVNKYKTKSLINEIKLLKSNIKDIGKTITNMENILDNSIHGHSNAKNQIMKIIGQWMNGERSGYSFGFEGSPGIGKTSLASKGLTKCLTNKEDINRPFNFIALGGSSHGSFLEGHSYTYLNSTWGKIVDILMDSKCMNPIIYIDELDKVSKTEQGKEIVGILTHLIDQTQNTNFQDKYFTGINIDVSKILFIFSYNDPEQIDKILLDRIHRIKFENLTIEEKITIVNKFILPEINNKMGFENIVLIDDDCIEYIIKSYTSEPGVRKLKEILFDLYGEINLQLLKDDSNKTVPININISNLEKEYLTKYDKIKEKQIHREPEIGIINGLWANSLGCGGIIPIQTLFYPSSVFLELKLTGLQGDVMKESMNVAKSLAWNLTDDNTKQNWLKYFEKTKCQGLHIHCPEGAISKDGPSAGAAITTAIYSLLNKKKIKNNIAITGEITLNGDVTAIGGLDIKINYGIRHGVTTFLFPKENQREYDIWVEKSKNKKDIRFIQVNNIKEIFNYVFI